MNNALSKVGAYFNRVLIVKIIVSIFLAIALAGLIFLFIEPQSDSPDKANPAVSITEKKDKLYVQHAYDQNQKDALFKSESSDASSKDIQEITDTANNKAKTIPYEENWCIKGVDLSEKDYLYAQQELRDWAAQRGEIWISNAEQSGNYIALPNSELLEPYKELDIEDLMALVATDDQYAMITALQRQGISWDLQDHIARRLLVLGSTSMSLNHFVTKELVTAVSAYERAGEITPEIELKLINALTYVFYGSSQYDSSVLFNYVTMIDGDEILRDKLLPNRVLSVKDYKQIEANVRSLSEKIDAQRSKENFVPLSHIDVPRIARKEFEERVAFMYAKYPQSMNTVSRLDIEIGPSVMKSECVEKYLKIFGEAGRSKK